MKRFIFVYALLIVVFTTSCEKEIFHPKTDEPVSVNEPVDIEEISIFGSWKLIDGKMYMENLETGEKVVFSHFDVNKTVSSTRYEGQQFEIERIVKNNTIWTFKQPTSIPNTGQFWLDNDSIQPYGLQITNSNMAIIEYTSSGQQMGGSARPLRAFIKDYDLNQVNFYIQEAYTSINGVNYKYFSELTFQKQ